MGARQREIPISEFFTKNRLLIGFDNPRKVLLTRVKEAVDNALDDNVVTVEVAPSNGEAPPPFASRFRRSSPSSSAVRSSTGCA